MLNFAQKFKEIVGSKNKLKRFSENETFSNVFQPTREEVVGNEFPLRGKWNSDFFKNDNPIVLELGCGKGEYSVGLAERFPEKNEKIIFESQYNDTAYTDGYQHKSLHIQITKRDDNTINEITAKIKID